jgi:hypothetical protein
VVSQKNKTFWVVIKTECTAGAGENGMSEYL